MPRGCFHPPELGRRERKVYAETTGNRGFICPAISCKTPFTQSSHSPWFEEAAPGLKRRYFSRRPPSQNSYCKGCRRQSHTHPQVQTVPSHHWAYPLPTTRRPLDTTEPRRINRHVGNIGIDSFAKELDPFPHLSVVWSNIASATSGIPWSLPWSISSPASLRD